MLLEFTFSNFRSFRKSATLSLVAGTGKDLLTQNTIPTGLAGIPRVVRTGALYGGNAAGKSNVLKALAFLRDRVLNSAHASQEGQSTQVEPFYFDGEGSQEASSMEVHFLVAGVRFEYGLRLTRKQVIEEWLHSSPKGRVSRWFHRELKNGRYSYEFGSTFQGQKNVWEKSTRDNALFLSTAVQLNSEQLKPVFSWFKDKLNVVGDTRFLPRNLGILLVEDPHLKKYILKIMKTADPSITDLVISKSEQKPLFGEAMMVSEVESAKKTVTMKDVVVFHGNVDETPAGLTLDNESRGTQQIFSMAFHWLSARAMDKTLLVDELDSSLHPLMTRALIDFFQKEAPPDTKGQLFFTTHDTSLLGSDLLRRDQIWFVEKDNHNSSCLYPLTDFSLRKREALEKGYLGGRYGALPRIEEIGS